MAVTGIPFVISGMVTDLAVPGYFTMVSVPLLVAIVNWACTAAREAAKNSREAKAVVSRVGNGRREVVFSIEAEVFKVPSGVLYF
jgi:hypothetical protein